MRPYKPSLEVQEGDLHQNVEMLAAAIALQLMDAPEFISSQASEKFPRMRNKAAIQNAILECASFNILLEGEEDEPTKSCSKCHHANSEIAQCFAYHVALHFLEELLLPRIRLAL